MTKSPRREWKSFLWVPRWSVRVRMRSERIATWTSGEPVSPDLTAYSPIRTCLRSGVIDIGEAPSTIDDAHRTRRAVRGPRQANKELIMPRADDRAVGDAIEARPFARIVRRHKLTV